MKCKGEEKLCNLKLIYMGVFFSVDQKIKKEKRKEPYTPFYIITLSYSNPTHFIWGAGMTV